MRSFYIRIIKFFNTNNNNLLGRWNLEKCDKKKEIKIFWANSDHCGDVICGNPIKSKLFLKTESLKK
tara:strand:- start:366 stop:566 length:201 start_codon:yes stop_codon:yes gene_type:complete